MPVNDDLAAFLENYRDAANRPSWILETIRNIDAGATLAQREFINDPHRNTVVIAPRRVGKTSGFLRKFCKSALTVQNGNFIYAALSRPHAEELLWEPLKVFAAEHKIQGRFYESDLKFEISVTGSIIHLVGADDKKEIDKKRGRALHGAGIDEAAAFPTRLLKYLIDQVLRPTLMDYRGWLALGGTPGATLDGEFYEATRIGAPRSRPWRERNGQEWGASRCNCPRACTDFKWSLHRWSINDAALASIKEEAKAVKEQNGWSDDNPIYIREYMGGWAADETGLVYRYRKHGADGMPWNTWTPGPRTPENPFGLPGNHKWRYVLGVDLGNKKATQEERVRNPDKQIPNRTALELLAYSDTCRELYHAHEMTFGDIGATQGRITELAGRIHWIRKQIQGELDGIYMDLAGAGGLVIDELAANHRLAVQAAEKKNKPDAIESMNADLIDGYFKVLEGSQLEQEFQTLQWDETDPTRENKSQANDHADAAIYAKRGALHHFAQEPARRPEPREVEEEKMRAPLRRETRLAIAERKRMMELEEDEDAYSEMDTEGMEP